MLLAFAATTGSSSELDSSLNLLAELLEFVLLFFNVPSPSSSSLEESIFFFFFEDGVKLGEVEGLGELFRFRDDDAGVDFGVARTDLTGLDLESLNVESLTLEASPPALGVMGTYRTGLDLESFRVVDRNVELISRLEVSLRLETVDLAGDREGLLERCGLLSLAGDIEGLLLFS